MHHLLPRYGRIGPRRTRIQEAQKIADLGHGSHRRAGILVGGFLLDGHDGAQPRDLVHVGPLHRSHELPRIGRKGLHVASLPLGIDGVEGQRRLARPRKAGDDHELVARNLQVHVLEVVHPRSEYFDRMFFHVVVGTCKGTEYFPSVQRIGGGPTAGPHPRDVPRERMHRSCRNETRQPLPTNDRRSMRPRSPTRA